MMDDVEIQRDLLTSLRLSDSSFPGGNFGFSNGLEAIISSEDDLDASELTSIILGLIENRWKTSDYLALRKCYRNIHDLFGISEVDVELDKTSTSSVAREGSINNGRALLGTASKLGDPRAAQYLHLIRETQAVGHLPIAQSLHWHQSGLDEVQAIHLSLYSTVSNYCQVAVRLGAVGALQAQQVMMAVIDDFSLPSSNEIWHMVPAAFTPFSDIATLKLSQQDLRLFRN